MEWYKGEGKDGKGKWERKRSKNILRGNERVTLSDVKKFGGSADSQGPGH